MSDSTKEGLDKSFVISQDFSFPSVEDWKKEAEKLLKGASFDKVLQTNTLEGITLKAIYHQEDLKDFPHLDIQPGAFPYVRGTSATQKITEGWKIQQEIHADNIQEWNRKLLQNLEKGQNSLRLKLDYPSSIAQKIEYICEDQLFTEGLPIYHYQDFCAALKGVDLTSIHCDLDAGCVTLPVFLMLMKYAEEHKINLSKLHGSVGGDIVNHLALHGFLPCSMEQLLDEIALVTKQVLAQKLSLKTILIDSTVWNENGDSAVGDLCLTASVIVFYVEELKKRGLTPDDIFQQMTFIMAVKTDIFLEIAKLRSARYLFAKLAEAYEVKPENAKMMIHVQTSLYTKTIYDPWVNILRTSTEAFSAVVGGCDSLQITPFDATLGKPDDFSNRIALNQHHILLEEARLNAVNDPAGGSYYVENLTFELSQKAWDYFLAIEQQEGIIPCLTRGLIQDKAEESHVSRLKNIETRKDSIVGTSTFPNLREKKLPKQSVPHPKPQSICANKEQIPMQYELLLDRIDQFSLDNFCRLYREDEPSSLIHKMPKRRRSTTFEEIRTLVEKINPRPACFVVNIGNVTSNKARVDFAISVFEPAGFLTETNEGFPDLREAINFVINSPARYIVISSTDDQYPEIIPKFAKTVKENAPDKIIILAGYPKDHLTNFTKAGVDFYIYLRCNIVFTIQEILRRAGEIS